IGTSESMNRRYGDSNDPRSALTVVLTLRHASPDDVAKELAGGLPDDTVIVPDKRTASVIITGSADTITRTRELVNALDAPAYAANSNNLAHVYQLRYLKPSDIKSALKDVLPDGSYVADDAQNAVVVSGNEEVQQAAAAFLHSMDVPSPEVLFEVRVADLEPQNDQTDVGVQFGGYDLSGQPISG